MPAPIAALGAAGGTIAVLRRWGPRVAAVVLPLLAFVIVLAIFMAFAVASQDDDPAPQVPGLGCTTSDIANAASITTGDQQTWPDDAQVGTPSQEQISNATAIIAAGHEKNVPDYGIVVALAVAAQESGWNNLDHGDRDSIGLFQQRTSWGTEKQLMDPHTSAGLFYDALLKVDGWQNMSIGQAGQAVQVSADSTGSWYAEHEPIARHAFTQITGDEAQVQCANNGVAAGCPPSPWPQAEEGITPDALRVLRCGAKQLPNVETVYTLSGTQDHPSGRAVDFMIPNWDSEAGHAAGDQLAAHMRQNADALGVKYIIWQKKIWNVERDAEGWRTCGGGSASCYSGSDPSAAHLNHVHVSVHGDAAGAKVATQPPAGSGTPPDGSGTLPDAANSLLAGQSGEWVHPLGGQSYSITVPYGQPGSWAAGYHQGADLALDQGSPIHAGCNGTVIFAGDGGAYGNFTKIDCGGGYQTWYAHQTSIQVAQGATVIAGQQIGTVGWTGRVFPASSKGSHLHFEVRENGADIDPQQFYADRGVTI